jgi:hypothetical protein
MQEDVRNLTRFSGRDKNCGEREGFTGKYLIGLFHPRVQDAEDWLPPKCISLLSLK